MDNILVADNRLVDIVVDHCNNRLEHRLGYCSKVGNFEQDRRRSGLPGVVGGRKEVGLGCYPRILLALGFLKLGRRYERIWLPFFKSFVGKSEDCGSAGWVRRGG